MDSKQKREAVIEEVKKMINGSREEDYGTPEMNFKRIASLWSIYLGFIVDKHDVAMMMALFKIARLMGGRTHDSYIDAIGYLTIAETMK